MEQNNSLYFTEQPVKETQSVPSPTVVASGADVAAVASDVSDLDDRVTPLEEMFQHFGNYADDTAAATGGVLVGEFYHNAGAVRVRLT